MGFDIKIKPKDIKENTFMQRFKEEKHFFVLIKYRIFVIK